MLQGSPHHNNLIRNSSSAALSSFNDMKKESPSISSTSSLASLGSGMPGMDLNHSSLTANPLHSYTSQMHHVMKDAKMNVASPYGHYNHHQSSTQRPSITYFFGKMMSFSSCHQSSAAAAAAMTPSAAASSSCIGSTLLSRGRSRTSHWSICSYRVPYISPSKCFHVQHRK